MAGEMSFVRNLDARIAAAEEDEASAPLSNPWIRSHGLQQINKAAKAGLRVWGFKLARDPFQTTVRGKRSTCCGRESGAKSRQPPCSTAASMSQNRASDPLT
jgi:hypothetical protein